MTATQANQEQMNVVIVGHVDHGKSTLIGRLLADTGSLPEGKLEQVKATCEINSRPFEYAFLLDALKDEQAQGITIDTARSFFKSDKRHYIIIDAPGHIEFLKNMITGAARAEAAMLLIDAHEGVQENSRRHGYMLSMLGIKQVVVLVNKMDLVDYDQDRYNKIVEEYTAFLTGINVQPNAFVPISAREGHHLLKPSDEMPWYEGKSVLELMDDFETQKEKSDQPFRFPVQDIYKFTDNNDDRRIVAGTIQTGEISVGDDVVFQPSGKTSQIKSIEGFNTESRTTVSSGEAVGFTLTQEIYIKPGEIMVKKDDSIIETGHTFKVNLFWLGKKPMIKNKKYMIKLGTARGTIYLHDIITVLDASELNSHKRKEEIDRHEVAECVLQTIRPLAFDLSQNIETTGRFVIIDDYEIAGGGIISENWSEGTSLEMQIDSRNYAWTRSEIKPEDRQLRLGQKPKFVVLTGEEGIGKLDLAKKLEKQLFDSGKTAYLMGISNVLLSMTRDARRKALEDRDEHIRRLGELAHIFNDAGLILLSSISNVDQTEMRHLKTINDPFETVVVEIGKVQKLDGVDLFLDQDSDTAELCSQIEQLL